MQRTEREIRRAQKIDRELAEQKDAWAERDELPPTPKTETPTRRPNGAPMIRG